MCQPLCSLTAIVVTTLQPHFPIAESFTSVAAHRAAAGCRADAKRRAAAGDASISCHSTTAIGSVWPVRTLAARAR